MNDPTAVDPMLVLLGLLGLVLAGGGAALLRLLRPAPPPPAHDGPTPLERAAREKEAAAKAAADEAHAKRIAEKVEIDKMPEGPERTKATGDWWERHRQKRGSVRAPGWLVGLFVVAVLALMLAVLAGCPAKAPPSAFGTALPPLPAEVLAEPAPPTLAVDACAVAALVPGSPLPAEIVDGALRGPPVAACRGIVVDENELLAAGQCEADRERLQAYLVAEHAARAGDRSVCESVYASEWTYGQDLRRDNQVLRWSGYGLGVAGLLVGVAIGFATGAVTP